MNQKYIGYRLTASGAPIEGLPRVRQGSRVLAPIALVALPAGSGGPFYAEPELPPIYARLNERLHLVALAPLAFRNRDPYLANMQIDSKRLTKDCTAADAARAGSDYPHRNTGATAIIEPVLPLIGELRAQKFSWASIASAFAKQGVVQGADRRPITARRLTALISAINKRERRREARLSDRSKRRDLAPLPASSHTLALSAELRRTDATAVAMTDSEATIRHQEFEDRVRSLLKADPP